MERRTLPSHPAYSADERGVIYGKRGKPLQLFAGVGGYLRFTTYEAGRWQQVSVHVMVCEAFNGRRPEGHHAAHTNGVRTDNRASNLSWKTAADNEADKLDHDVRAWGERHGMHKLNEADVRSIRASEESSYSLASRYGVTSSTIRSIRRRASWRHI